MQNQRSDDRLKTPRIMLLWLVAAAPAFAALSNTVGITTTVETFNVVNFNGNNTNATTTASEPFDRIFLRARVRQN